MNNSKSLTCNHCKHNWQYKGKSSFYASCPNCHYKVNITKSLENK